MRHEPFYIVSRRIPEFEKIKIKNALLKYLSHEFWKYLFLNYVQCSFYLFGVFENIYFEIIFSISFELFVKLILDDYIVYDSSFKFNETQTVPCARQY